MKNLTILQTPIRFYPYIGGVENHVYYLSRELIKRNKVTVLCANEPKSNKKVIDGIKVSRLNYQFKITNTNIALTLPYKIITSNYDIIHTHMPTPWTADWSVFLAKATNKKSIITIHNDMNKSSFLSKIITKFYLFTIFQLTLLLVDKIIIVNPDWQKTFTSTKNILLKHKNKISILPNGIDINMFNNKTKINKKNTQTILFVSILDKHHKFKGIDYLLEAIIKVKKVIPNIKLKIIGEGELNKYYQKMSINLKIDENVEFLGKVKQKDLAKHYNQSSIFALPSTEIEGFGIVLLEAMACKLPVIATEIAGVSNDIKINNTGLIINKKDSQALADAIIKLLKDRELSTLMGKNGRKLIENKYDWKIIANQLEKIYEEVLLKK